MVITFDYRKKYCYNLTRVVGLQYKITVQLPMLKMYKKLKTVNKVRTMLVIACPKRIIYRRHTWKFLLYIFILDVLSLTAYSPSDDQTNSSAEPKDLFLHANAVYMIYSPSPQTTTNRPFGLCFKLWQKEQNS